MSKKLKNFGVMEYIYEYFLEMVECNFTRNGLTNWKTFLTNILKNIFRFGCRSSDPYLCLRDPAGDREVLEKVQEKAVKMVTGLKAVSYEDRCAELGLETLQVRRERLDMALLHKYIGKKNQTLFRMMSENGGARTRRAAGAKNIASQYARTDIRKESFAIRVVETWNRLPDSVKLTEKPESFKKELKKL
jgi:hypothetical protein